MKDHLFRFYQQIKSFSYRLILWFINHKIKALFLFTSFFILIFLSLFIFRPNPAIENITLSNLTDRSVTISWKTSVPTTGEIVIQKQNKFAFLPQNGVLDDHLKYFKKDIPLDLHHITLTGLSPDSQYFFKIYNGIWQSRIYKVRTLPTNRINNLPNPVYGHVSLSDHQTPAVGVVVYLILSENKRNLTLSTLTNSKGNYSLDFNTSEFKNPKMQIFVEAGRRGNIKAAISKTKMNPIPDIVLPYKK